MTRLRLRVALDTVLRSPRSSLLAAFLGMALALPAVQTGWFADDHFHRLVLQPPSRPDWLRDLASQTHPLDLFRFFDGNRERNRELLDIGFVPWWTSERAKGAFLRPLSSFTHWLDYQLWPQRSALMHLQSIAWYGLLILAVGALHRQVFDDSRVAALATLLFAIDDAHAMPIAFLANRNALVAGVFATAAIVCYLRASATPSWKLRAAATSCYAVSLLAGEAGISTLAYVAAHELCRAREPWLVRLRETAPLLAVTVAWRLLWAGGGYGVGGIGVYIDPLGDPLRFVEAALTRIPFLLAGQFTGITADLAMLASPGTMALVATLVLIAALPAYRLTRSAFTEDPSARFWLVGAVLAAVPVSATFTSDRLLLMIGIGASALVARLIASTVTFAGTERTPRSGPPRGQTIVALVAVAVHVVLAPVLLPLRVGTTLGPARFTRYMHVLTPLDETIEGQTVVIVNAPFTLFVGMLPLIRGVEGLPVPRRTRLLAPSTAAVTLARPDSHTLVLQADPPFFSIPWDRLYRDPAESLRLGDETRLSDMVVRVTGVDSEARPNEIAYRFNEPLESDGLRWLMWNGDAFVPTQPPAVGTEVSLPRALPRWR